MRKYFVIFLLLTSWALCAQNDSALYSEEPIFSHQFKYLNDDKYQFIDTSFNSLKWYYQLNNTIEDDFGHAVLTNIGGARNSLLLPQMPDFWDYQQFGPYTEHFTLKSEVPFYHVRSPITEGKYIAGYNRGQTFLIYHTQNVHERWNFHIRYKRLNSLGFYTNNQNRQSSFLANSAYTSPKGNYIIKGYLISERLEVQEYGGLEDDSLFLANAEGSPELIAINLSTDSRTMRNREFYLSQELKFARFGKKKEADPNDSTVKAKEPSSYFSLGHEFQYTRRSQVYEGASKDFYENYFFTSESGYKDSMAYHAYDNFIYLRTKIGDTNRFNLTAGIRNLAYNYQSEDFGYFNSTWGLSGTITGKLANLISVEGNLDYALTGELANTFKFEGKGKLSLTSWLKAQGGYVYTLRYPELYQQLHIGNNYIWQNNFNPYSLGILSYGVNWPMGGALMIKNFNATKYIVFGEEGSPLAAPSAIKYTQFDLKQNLTFWEWLHFDNRLVYQVSTSGEEYLPLPDWITRSALYASFRIFKRKLQVMAGAELEYFSRFESREYNPALGRFQLSETGRSIGNYPFMNVFAQFKVRKAMIFLKYQHVNQGFNGYDYFAAPDYPMNNRVLRVGINWRFFN